MQLLKIEDVENLPGEKVEKLVKLLQEEHITFQIYDMEYIGK